MLTRQPPKPWLCMRLHQSKTSTKELGCTCCLVYLLMTSDCHMLDGWTTTAMSYVGQMQALTAAAWWAQLGEYPKHEHQSFECTALFFVSSENTQYIVGIHTTVTSKSTILTMVVPHEVWLQSVLTRLIEKAWWTDSAGHLALFTKHEDH